MVQMVTNTVKIKNGDHARMICPRLYSEGTGPPEDGLFTTIAPAECPMLIAVSVFFGRQTLRNKESETILTSAEVISGSSGPI